MKAIKNAGGHTFAQEPLTSEYPVMPKFAIATGFVDSIFEPAIIGHELSLNIWIGTELQCEAEGIFESRRRAPKSEEALSQIALPPSDSALIDEQNLSWQRTVSF